MVLVTDCSYDINDYSSVHVKNLCFERGEQMYSVLPEDI